MLDDCERSRLACVRGSGKTGQSAWGLGEVLVVGNSIIEWRYKIKKNKTVKEKNDKNEITKYQITISIDTTVEKIVDKETIKFNITNSGEFRVASKNSQSIINEKKLTALLTENISSKIAEEIIKKIDDI